MKKHKIFIVILIIYSVVATFLLYNKSFSSEDTLSQNYSVTSSYFDNIKSIKLKEQDFWGKWKIVDCIGTDYEKPSRYSGIDDKGEVRGKDWDKVLDLVIEITPTHIESQGVVYPYDENYMPEIYILSVKSNGEAEDNQIDNIAYYYKDETLGFLDMEYVPYVFFALAQNTNLTSEIDYSEDYNIWDFNEVYLKDENTAYIGDGIQLFLIKRVHE